jgi:membrane protease YdiL (CAAX protease family)
VNESGPTSRFPNLGHFAFFLALTFFSLFASAALVLAFMHGGMKTLEDQRALTIVSLLTYVIALLLAYFAMPVFWHRPFLAGVNWNGSRVKWWMGLGGLAMGFVAQVVTRYLPVPDDLPIDKLFRDPGAIWFLAFFAVVVAPLFEEMMFRGFLLPAIAIAVDWVRLPRGPEPMVVLENLIAWRSRSEYSKEAWIAASVLTSFAFVLIHGPQLAYTLPAMALLMVVSLVLCAVRIGTGSVAASALVHSCYNLSVFVSLFVATGGFRHLDKL